jgi:hypothetical protein
MGKAYLAEGHCRCDLASFAVSAFRIGQMKLDVRYAIDNRRPDVSSVGMRETILKHTRVTREEAYRILMLSCLAGLAFAVRLVVISLPQGVLRSQFDSGSLMISSLSGAVLSLPAGIHFSLLGISGHLWGFSAIFVLLLNFTVVRFALNDRFTLILSLLTVAGTLFHVLDLWLALFMDSGARSITIVTTFVSVVTVLPMLFIAMFSILYALGFTDLKRRIINNRFRFLAIVMLISLSFQGMNGMRDYILRHAALPEELIDSMFLVVAVLQGIILITVASFFMKWLLGSPGFVNHLQTIAISLITVIVIQAFREWLLPLMSAPVPLVQVLKEFLMYGMLYACSLYTFFILRNGLRKPFKELEALEVAESAGLAEPEKRYEGQESV